MYDGEPNDETASEDSGRGEAFILISPGSRRLTPDYVHTVGKVARDRGRRLQAILLDRPEVRNQMLLRGLSESVANREVAVQVDNWVLSLGRDIQPNTSVIRQSSLLEEPGLIASRNLVQDTYRSNSSFRRHCLNQTFQHLQPVLRKFGVERKKDPLVGELSSYLIEELALLAFLGQTGRFAEEYGPLPRMSIVGALLSGKYPELNELASALTPYEQILGAGPPLDVETEGSDA